MGGDCREASQRRDVPSGFRYAKRSDEPKAENTRGEALLFSWSHPMAYIHPAETALLCLAKPEFAG